MSVRVRGSIAAVLVGLMCILPVLSACSIGSSSPTSPASTGPVWGFPFKTGTSVTLGCFGLHDDNIFADGSYSFTNQKPQGGVPPQNCPPPHVDDPTHANGASLDLLTAAVGVPVIPLASGTVLIADEACHFIVVDHGGGTWVAYLHLDVQVTVGQKVTRDSVLGTTAAPHGSTCEHSNAPHVHFAFLHGSGHSGSYVSMVGKVLCGYQVIQNAQYPNGALQQVAPPHQIIAPGSSFTVTDCPSSSSSVLGASTSPAATPTPSVRPGAITEFPVPTPESSPRGITAGPDGALWFTESDANKIGRITLSGTITEFPILTAGSGPQAIAAGPDGALWFTEASADQIGRITTAGVVTEFRIPTGGSNPEDITAGPDGTLWFTEFHADQIGRITMTGAVTEFPIPSPQGGPRGITVGPDGALWFTEDLADWIGRITTTGVITKISVPPTDSARSFIASGPDGALWFTEEFGFRIGRVTTAGTVTTFPLPLPDPPEPAGITAGVDGALWFAEYNGYPNDEIGRVTTSGMITQFPIPTGDGGPIYITSGPDGALWFTEAYSGKIGRITA